MIPQHPHADKSQQRRKEERVTRVLQFQYSHSDKVRIDLDADDYPWWVATDVGSILGYSQIAEILKRLDDDEKGIRRIDTPGGPQDLWCVNEPGLYTLIIGSKKLEAKPFKRWVTHTVLPQIRRTGSYSINQQVVAQYVAPKPRPHQTYFTREFYQHLYRVRGKRAEFPDDTCYPNWTARDIDNLIYRRSFPVDVMRVVRARNPRTPSGGRVRRHGQHLSEDVGERQLIVAVGICLHLMRQAHDMAHLLYMLDLVAPIRQHEMPFREVFQGQLTRGTSGLSPHEGARHVS